jgi:gas vesicle protein
MNASKVVLSIAAGVAAGALIGVLFAPDSGANTRKKISRKSGDFVDDIKTKMGGFVDQFIDQVEATALEAHQMADDVTDKAKAKYNGLKSDVKKHA